MATHTNLDFMYPRDTQYKRNNLTITDKGDIKYDGTPGNFHEWKRAILIQYTRKQAMEPGGDRCRDVKKIQLELVLTSIPHLPGGLQNHLYGVDGSGLERFVDSETPLNSFIEIVRNWVFPQEDKTKIKCYHQFHRPGGPMVRGAQESFKAYIERFEYVLDTLWKPFGYVLETN